MRSPLRRPIVPLAFIALGASASAQFDTVNYERSEFYLPSTTLDPVSRIDDGYLFGALDGVTDVAVLFGDRVMVLKDPGCQRHRIEIAPDTNDLAICSMASASDVIFTVGTTGLGAWSWDGTSFTDLSGTKNLTHPDWVGATRIGCADLNGDGTEDLFGLAADGLQILTSTKSERPWANTNTMTPGPAIVALEAIQWDGVGDMEFAIRTQTTLAIIDSLNSVVFSEVLPEGGGLLAVMDRIGTTQQLVLADSGLIGSASRTLEARGAGSSHTALDLGQRPIVSMEVGHIDGSSGNAVEDLILSYGDTNEVGLFRGLPYLGAVEFVDTFAQQTLPVRKLAGTTGAAPYMHLVDLDGDRTVGEQGDMDLIYSSDGLNEVIKYSNETTSAASFTFARDGVDVGVNSVTGEMEFTLTLLAPTAGSWDRAKVRVQRQRRFDFLLDDAYLREYSEPLTGGQLTLTVPTGRTGWFEDIYFLEIRGARGPISAPEVGPAAVIGFGVPESLRERETYHPSGGGAWSAAVWIGANDPLFSFPVRPIVVLGDRNPLFPIFGDAYTYPNVLGGAREAGGGSTGGPVLPPFPPFP